LGARARPRCAPLLDRGESKADLKSDGGEQTLYKGKNGAIGTAEMKPQLSLQKGK